MDEVIGQFSVWEDTYCYQIKEAWIDTPDGKRIDFKKQWTVMEKPTAPEGGDLNAHDQ